MESNPTPVESSTTAPIGTWSEKPWGAQSGGTSDKNPEEKTSPVQHYSQVLKELAVTKEGLPNLRLLAPLIILFGSSWIFIQDNGAGKLDTNAQIIHCLIKCAGLLVAIAAALIAYKIAQGLNLIWTLPFRALGRRVLMATRDHLLRIIIGVLLAVALFVGGYLTAIIFRA